jgi:hypothetical protein
MEIFKYTRSLVAGIALSVLSLATGYTVEGSEFESR